MFLGGALDHTTRILPINGPLCVPDEVYVAELKRHGKLKSGSWGMLPPDERPTQTYARTRVTSGTKSWWVYVLVGHNPPRSHLLDANPYPVG